MKFDDLKRIAEQGQLTVFKRPYRNRTRRQFIWNDDHTEIMDEKLIPYTVYTYGARCEWQAENQFYKITKNDYELLEKIIQEKSPPIGK